MIPTEPASRAPHGGRDPGDECNCPACARAALEGELAAGEARPVPDPTYDEARRAGQQELF